MTYIRVTFIDCDSFDNSVANIDCGYRLKSSNFKKGTTHSGVGLLPFDFFL